MFIHDYIKMIYIEQGYLPNYSYYLISDKEMVEAFWKEGGFFEAKYPCPYNRYDEEPCADLVEPYKKLKEAIWLRLEAYLKDPENSSIPNWVYSYMIMNAVTYESLEQDISYISEMVGIDTRKIEAEFTPEVARGCYYTSVEWLKKRPSQFKDRPPTMFGEPHVIKCLRLKEANIFIETESA